MAASAADIRSALNLPESFSIPGPSQPKKQTGTTSRKPEGIPRELYQLIGPAAPSLAAQFAKPRLKQKPNLGGSSKSRWELKKFKNPARPDGLELEHWERVTTDGPKESPFAKYNVRPPLYTSTQEEYTRLLEDKEWTKEETDYLFQMVHDYDVRWYVIYDRYEFPGGPMRALDDLKDRYYSVCRKLIRNRPWQGDEASKLQLLSSYQFDKERELTRKKYIQSLENRTPEQLAEEEALYIEIKRLEQNERKYKRDRESLLRTLAGMDSGLPDVAEDDLASLGGGPDGKKKKKGGATELESPATPSTATTPAIKRPQSTKDAARDAQHCIIRSEVPVGGIATKAAHQPAYLRSFKLPYPKAALAPKITQALAEIGISHSRLVMPNKDTIGALEALMEATTHLIETKRAVDKAEADIAQIKERIALRNNEQSGEQGGEGGEGGADLDAMNIDDAQGSDTEEGRSVVSASGRSRKHPRRSMSISSVDTTSTAARPNMKRQKRG